MKLFSGFLEVYYVQRRLDVTVRQAWIETGIPKLLFAPLEDDWKDHLGGQFHRRYGLAAATHHVRRHLQQLLYL